MASAGSLPFYAKGLVTADGDVSAHPEPAAENKGAVLDYQDLVDFVAEANVAELKDLVASGELSASEVVEAEKAGKNRKSVLAFSDDDEKADDANAKDDAETDADYDKSGDQ
jgi:hypothetical protein